MSQNCEEEMSIIRVKPIEVVIAGAIRRYFKGAVGPQLIAVGGAGGIGKSTFSKKLARALGETKVLPLDDYKTPRDFRKELGIFGPHPKANEMELINEHLAMIKSDIVIDKPIYCSKLGRAFETEKYFPKKFNIIEGEVATYKEFSYIIDLHIFIDASLDTQLQTRLIRDVQSRGYSMEKALATFKGSNIDEFGKYGALTKAWADIVLFCDKNYSLSIQELSIPETCI